MRALLSAVPGTRQFVFAAVLCLLLPHGSMLHAQPDLQLTRTWVSWPNISLYFRVQCQGVSRVDMQKGHFRLRDDGSEVTDFTLHTPPPSGQPFSSLLLFDASGSMAGPYQQGAIDAGRAFIDRMDGVQDEAAIYWFTETLTSARRMTTRKDWLKTAMNALPASGGSAIWDALFEAIEELDFSASYDCRSITVLSDGVDNSSTHTYASVINSANMRNIRINFIGLGLNSSEGARVARQTGGKYFTTTDPAALVDIYRELFTDLRFCYSECSVSYERDCADGQLFDVELQLQGYCLGSDEIATQFRAPLDLGTFQTLDFSLDGARVQGGNDLQMTVWLRPPVEEATFQPFAVPLQFDTSLLRLEGVSAPPGVLMNGVPLSITPRMDGALITSQTAKHIGGGGAFFELHFSTSPQQDTVHTTVTLGDFWFNSGCLRSFSTSATVGLFPPGAIPLVYCESPGSFRLQWDRMSENYLPNPFPVMARFLNTGSIDAKEARFVIEYDSSALSLRQPLQDTIIYAFADITPGSHAAVSWDLETPLRLSDVRSEVCITALFDNHPPVRCCAEVEIPRADGILRCSMSAPEITVDRETGSYTPMPFPLTVEVENVGGRAADNVTARLLLPPEMQLAAPDAPDRFQKSVGSSALVPGGKVTLQWMLQHPVVPTPRLQDIRVTLQSPSTAAHTCSYDLPIPGLDLSDFRFSLIPGGPLRFCEGDSVVLDASSGRNSYAWNTGDSTRRIVVRQSGRYFCVVTDGGRRGFSDTIDVHVLPAPRPVITAGGSLPLCAGDTVALDAGEGYVSYAWNTGDTLRHIRVHTAGTYFCTVTGADGCIGRSDSVRVDVMPLPDAPEISRSGDILNTASAAHYRWYRDDVPLPDSDNQFLAVTETGRYRVRITDAHGCSAWSEVFVVDVLAVRDDDALLQRFELFPDPARDRLDVVLQLRQPEAVQLAVFDMLGRTLLQRDLHAAGAHRASLNLGEWRPGLYFLRVRTVKQTLTRSFRIEASAMR